MKNYKVPALAMYVFTSFGCSIPEKSFENYSTSKIQPVIENLYMEEGISIRIFYEDLELEISPAASAYTDIIFHIRSSSVSPAIDVKVAEDSQLLLTDTQISILKNSYIRIRPHAEEYLTITQLCEQIRIFKNSEKIERPKPGKWNSNSLKKNRNWTDSDSRFVGRLLFHGCIGIIQILFSIAAG